MIFQPAWERVRCCSEKHGKYLNKIERREAGLSTDRRKKERLRIAERDEYRCYLCTLPVDMTLVHPDLASPSVDHFWPLNPASGVPQGMDDDANKYLAHLGCNITKGNRHPFSAMLEIRKLYGITILGEEPYEQAA